MKTWPEINNIMKAVIAIETTGLKTATEDTPVLIFRNSIIYTDSRIPERF